MISVTGIKVITVRLIAVLISIAIGTRAIPCQTETGAQTILRQTETGIQIIPCKTVTGIRTIPYQMTTRKLYPRNF